MNGLDLSEAYYSAFGATMLREKFGAFKDRIAVGLVGPGSECFGFDDIISRDHDWGPAFCLWLTEEDNILIGKSLEKAYKDLPLTYKDFGPRHASHGEEWRVGVCKTTDFFRRFTSLDRPPVTIQEWQRIPEQNLATCTNGKVFSDPLGEFSRWRQLLLAYYPEDIRLIKISSLCITIAQTGQYNFMRSIRRSEIFSATVSLVKFCTDALGLAFLLNRQYAPFYKWLHRAVKNLPVLGHELHRGIDYLMNSRELDHKAEIIEEISALLADEIRRQGLSDSPSNFLLDHAPIVHEKISDPLLRQGLT